jgi:transcriptional regulator with XRE-family HTH domain
MATAKKKRKRRISDAIRDLDEWIGDDKGFRREIAESALHNAAAQLVYDARSSLGWTQAQLAQRVGSRQSVISRIEDSDYHGHSLSMLQRIAFEMGLEVDIRFRKNRQVLGALPKSMAAELSAERVRNSTPQTRRGHNSRRKRGTR